MGKQRESSIPATAQIAAKLLPCLLLTFCLGSAAFAFDPLNGDYTRDDPLDIRIVSYNHHGDFIEDPSKDDAFDRILTALDFDIICFQEFSDDVSENDVADRLDSILPISGGSWEIHFGLLAGIRTVIASRFPLTMTRIDTIPASSTRGVTIALADLPDADYPLDVYLLGVHLKCCGDPGGPEDESRQDSADAIANWLGDARGVSRPSGNNVTLPDDTPMINLGDFNLVGGPQPEDTLITGDIQDESTYGPDVKGDWDVSDMTDLHPTDPFTGDDFTWQGSGTYPPSRLDRFFYTDSVVTVANSFILNTDTMTPAALAVAGLQAGDTLPENSSDHLPLAMDLRLVSGPECTEDADCDDGLFCNGAETCDANGDCQPGSDPCPGQMCRESDDTCVNCLDDGDCDDDLFCNGAETCDANGDCQPGSDPCPGQMCRESDDTCVNCLDDGDCDDDLFCNGAETCDANGDCQPGSDPCPGQICQESDDTCIDCVDDADCDDDLFCNGEETCDVNGDCQPGNDPCPGQMCRESDDTCVNCLGDTDCDDGVFCNGAEICDANGDCQPGSDPCPGQMCRESDDTCVDCLDDTDCDDGNPCNGLETCDANGVCQPGFCDTTIDVIDQNFDSGTGTFTYQDDTFRGTSNPVYADGTYESSGGLTGGGVRVVLGPVSTDMSGGWVSDFEITGAPTSVEIELAFRLLFNGGYESDEYGQALLSVDDTLIGVPPNDYLHQFVGNGSADWDSGWLTEIFSLALSAGTHEIIVGGFNNKSTYSNEITEVFFDDVKITAFYVGQCECDDGLFCNGEETCVGDVCEPGPDPCPGQYCREDIDACVDCLGDGDCDNGLFCDGAETCDANGYCQPGDDPCPGQQCREGAAVCCDTALADGDMNGVGGTNGEDIQLFIDAVLSGSTDPSDVCAGDFDDNGAVGFDDIDGMVTALLTP